MRTIPLIMAALLAAPALASDFVPGYIRKDGAYVQPHFKTEPNSTKLDNYSTQGNVNPYTGQRGTVDPYKPTTPAPSNPYGGSSCGYTSSGRYVCR